LDAKSLLQDLAIELSSTPNMQSNIPTGLMGSTGQNVHLLARVYRILGIWQWALSPGLDDDSIQGGCLLSTVNSVRSCLFGLVFLLIHLFFVQRSFHHLAMPLSMKQNGEKHGTHGLCSIQE